MEILGYHRWYSSSPPHCRLYPSFSIHLIYSRTISLYSVTIVHWCTQMLTLLSLRYLSLTLSVYHGIVPVQCFICHPFPVLHLPDSYHISAGSVKYDLRGSGYACQTLPRRMFSPFSSGDGLFFALPRTLSWLVLRLAVLCCTLRIGSFLNTADEVSKAFVSHQNFAPFIGHFAAFSHPSSLRHCYRFRFSSSVPSTCLWDILFFPHLNYSFPFWGLPFPRLRPFFSVRFRSSFSSYYQGKNPASVIIVDAIGTLSSGESGSLVSFDPNSNRILFVCPRKDRP